MSQILNKVRDLDPHDVDAAKEALSSFFPNLSKHKDGDCVRWLRALENVINRFPKQCGSQRATIEKYIINFLDTSSYNTVVEAAKCAHALQQVRPGQEKAATPKVCWRDMMSTLCNTVHNLIPEIFPNAANIYRVNGEQENKTIVDTVLISTLSELSVVSGQDRILKREHVLCTRLRNVFIFIQAMLVEIYPVAKPVRPQIILDAIIQALSASADAAQSADMVATVKTQALRTLDALVACLGSNLIPFSPIVFKCVMQTLRWSSDNSSPGESSSVRVTAYNSLSAWLCVLRSHRAPAPVRAGWHDELLAHVCGDVTPQRHTVTLTMNNPPRNLSKKQKKKQARMMLQHSAIAAYAPGELNKTSKSLESNEATAIAALECAETFLTVCGIFLKPQIHKVLHELLVRSCCQLADCSGERGVALLRALEASRKTAPPGVPPPTQYCLQLYSATVNSQCREISKFCSQALLDIRLHLHCSPPSLSFAAELQTEPKGAEEKRRMSRRNRDALESLLGVDRVPPEICDAEDVTRDGSEDTPDEPVTKKPRVDNISLSSSSDTSVQICDSDSEVEEIPMEDSPLEPVPEQNTITIHADVHEISTEDLHRTMSMDSRTNIHEATTQVPVDTVDGDSLSGKSNEVIYGYPTEKPVAVLENLEDENLPNTNETDDVHITCGQTVCTPEEESEKEPKVNGVKSPEKLGSPEKLKSPENNLAENTEMVEGSVSVKMAVTSEGVSVEDMMADFVDEVNDDNVTQA